MKRFLPLVLALLLCGCAVKLPEPTTTTPISAPTEADTTATDLSGYTDLELMEQTLLSQVCASLPTSSYWYTDDEWVAHVKKNCPEFRELMSRGTAVDAFRANAAGLIEQYRQEKPLHIVGFECLTTALLPELEGTLNPDPVEPNWLASEAYSNFLRIAIGGSVPLRYMHFEDEAAEKAYSDGFVPYIDASEFCWRQFSDTLYAVTARVFMDKDSLGLEVTHFVGCIGDRWLVMLSADQIPAELKHGLDLSECE